jgi:ABC-type phosphate transport system substrate-binding protein
MTRVRTNAIVAAAFVATLLQTAPSGAGSGFVIVVNQANPLDRLDRGELSKLFLKRTPAWPNGRPAAPCDLSSSSPARKAFSQEVLGKPVWVVVAFWQQEIASGRSQPPPACSSEPAALQAVRDDPGAVAYVAEGTALGPGLKVLALEP